MEKLKVLRLVFAVLFLVLPAVAYGQLITIEISGQVTDVSDEYGHLEDKIHINDTFTGTYTYDSAALDSNPDPIGGFYGYSTTPAGINLTVGGFEFKTDPIHVDFSLGVSDNDMGKDRYEIFSRYNLYLSNGTPVQYIFWDIKDSTGTALSSDALPLVAPDLTKWSSNVLRISTDRDFTINAVVTSATLVPEPAMLLLLSYGLWFTRRLSK